MLKLRLKRIGRKHDPSFRVVITESTVSPKGKYLEAVGFYNSNLKQIKLDADRIKYWLSQGVQPTDGVHNLLVKEGILDAAKKTVHSTRIRKKAEVAEDSGVPPLESQSGDQKGQAPEEEKKEKKNEEKDEAVEEPKKDEDVKGEVAETPVEEKEAVEEPKKEEETTEEQSKEEEKSE